LSFLIIIKGVVINTNSGILALESHLSSVHEILNVDSHFVLGVSVLAFLHVFLSSGVILKILTGHVVDRHVATELYDVKSLDDIKNFFSA
jgi:hypothetical protein